MEGNTQYHDAYGTGLELTEDGYFVIKDNKKPVWVESTWDTVSFRLFRQASAFANGMLLLTGICVLIFSLLLVIASRRMLRMKFKLA